MIPANNPRFQPHILVISGDTAAEREFEIEHPDACPLVCFWCRDIATQDFRERMAAAFDVPVELALTDGGHHDCYLQFEVDAVGLDGLDLGEDAPDDGTYEATEWGMDGWRRLPPGRYLIEAWFRQGLGLMPWGEDESEGGLLLIGPA